ncbi:MGH1-like glycoside hydrolase domain-containing protein [Rhodospirillaceae bacterium SYSU D60014]|uniref:amylo-alpha-1,6-glucosidase n=1 Tax=Virgifigura deserti TaxID=2268457 RepID=UPI000E6674BF
MAESTVPLQRAWNSWDSEHPAEMQYLPLGLRITPCAYASSTNGFTRFTAGSEGVRLGPRTIDGSCIALDLAHAGTALSLNYHKPDPFTLCGSWEAHRTGEWGLRFWVLLVLRLAPPTGDGDLVDWHFDPESGAMTARSGATHIVIRGERPPLLATFHDSLDALQQEFETKGYFYLESRGSSGPVAVLRYNLEEMSRFRFVATLANDPVLAVRQAATQLEEPPPQPSRAEGGSVGTATGALDAIRDVIGWNSVWDSVNRRPYTTASRNWVTPKFGGFGIWLNDALYHALMAGLFDVQLARENLLSVLAGATPQGNLPCLVTGRDAWIDRSQPPIGAFITWLLYLRTGDRDLLTLAADSLLRNHEWWWRERDGNGDGLVEYGTSPLGSGLYRGTKLAAKDESSMDNSPVHDEAVLDAQSRTLDCADVGLNSLLALDGEMLARMMRVLGQVEIADRLESRSEVLRQRIQTELWDEERGVFANRLWSGKFVRSLAPTSFYPLLAGAATPEQVEKLLLLLKDERKFGGRWLLPSVTRDDPAFADNVYWRGRIWPPLNFLVYHGLRRYGFEDEAGVLADNACRLFMAEWAPHRRCAENYNADTGAVCDQPDTDPFYSWGALLPLMSLSETLDLNPWNGWEVTHHAEEGRVGPVLTPAGEAVVATEAGCLTLSIRGGWTLRTNLLGRIRHLRLEAQSVGLTLPPINEAGAPKWLELRRERGRTVALARIAGRPIDCEADGDVLRFRLPASDRAASFELLLDTDQEAAAPGAVR